ncbi:PAP2 superfamily [Rubrobacter radiotolerans]|uniref:PAP2 superfamily n=1 Tax=Rubrobacter radiotolerans TaxID=42256 RepID=A0A023X609_RUBRA|nr:phosphatase PAP2 family protein [Rubrobacter radiotolerans]AHY47435.1 PAP2 superfamily [Rubrobacter radiotolerans]MDX5894838.1 phosphatase PAP2 family protein [Rubrobacter radiotolerans]SMC06874.1 undecaprenyl-diphosphatase [Rubrobacter radiotolerans DSM 5868]
MRSLVEADRALFRALFSLKWDPLSAVMRVATVAGTAGAVWGMAAFVGFLLTWLFSGFSAWSLAFPWAAIAASWTISEGAKYLFNRARPFIRDREIAPLIKTPSSTSFPSGHSATAAAGAITLGILYPPLAPLFALGGLLVMASRVYLGVHYPFDVFAGAMIGALVSVGLFFLGGYVR